MASDLQPDSTASTAYEKRAGNGAVTHRDSRNNALNKQQLSQQAPEEDQIQDDETEWVYSGLDPDIPRRSFAARIRGFTFAWFALCMSMAGFAILVGRIPDAYRCRGIQTLGDIIFVVDLVLFIAIHVGLACRFYLYPRAFKTMLQHPIESSYLCAWLQAFATIIVATEIYGFQHCGKWLVKVALVAWFIEVAIAIVLSVALPVVHFLDHPHGHKEMPPSFMLMPTTIVYVATTAYGLVGQLPVYTGIWLFWLSYIMLGYGMFLFIFYLALWFQKQLSGGMHEGRNALTPFMIVGMTSYTAGGLFGLGERGAILFPQYSAYIGHDYLASTGSIDGITIYDAAGSSFHMFNLALGLLFYGFTWWCLLISFTMSFSVWRRGKASPSLSAMLSCAFPTSGIIVDTWDIARMLGSTNQGSGARWLDIVGIVMLFIWVFGFCAGISGIAYKISKGKLLWEGKDDNAPAFNYVGEFEKRKKCGVEEHQV